MEAAGTRAGQGAAPAGPRSRPQCSADRISHALALGAGAGADRARHPGPGSHEAQACGQCCGAAAQVDDAAQLRGGEGQQQDACAGRAGRGAGGGSDGAGSRARPGAARGRGRSGGDRQATGGRGQAPRTGPWHRPLTSACLQTAPGTKVPPAAPAALCLAAPALAPARVCFGGVGARPSGCCCCWTVLCQGAAVWWQDGQRALLPLTPPPAHLAPLFARCLQLLGLEQVGNHVPRLQQLVGGGATAPREG